MFELRDFKNIKLPKMPNVKNTIIAHFQQLKSDKIFYVDIAITSQTQAHESAVSVQTVEVAPVSARNRGEQHLLFLPLWLLVQLIWSSFV